MGRGQDTSKGIGACWLDFLYRTRRRLLPGTGCGAYRIMGNPRKAQDYASSCVGIGPKQSKTESTTQDRIPVSDTADKYRENSEDDAEEYEDKDEKELEEESPDNALFKQRRLFEEDQDEDRKDESLSVGDLEGRLDRALEFAQARSRATRREIPYRHPERNRQFLEEVPQSLLHAEITNKPRPEGTWSADERQSSFGV